MMDVLDFGPPMPEEANVSSDYRPDGCPVSEVELGQMCRNQHQGQLFRLSGYARSSNS